MQLDEVQLDVLARRDVPEAARVLVGHLGERPELRAADDALWDCLLYTSPSPRDRTRSRMPSSA